LLAKGLVVQGSWQVFRATYCDELGRESPKNADLDDYPCATYHSLQLDASRSSEVVWRCDGIPCRNCCFDGRFSPMVLEPCTRIHHVEKEELLAAGEGFFIAYGTARGPHSSCGPASWPSSAMEGLRFDRFPNRRLVSLPPTTCWYSCRNYPRSFSMLLNLLARPTCPSSSFNVILLLLSLYNFTSRPHKSSFSHSCVRIGCA
jgi:hypothetical protein